MSDAPLAVQVAVQKQIIALLWDRLALVDAQNIALNQRLEESLSAVDKAMLRCPRRLRTLGLRAGAGSSGRCDVAGG